MHFCSFVMVRFSMDFLVIFAVGVLLQFRVPVASQTTGAAPPVQPAYQNSQLAHVRQHQCGVLNGDASIFGSLKGHRMKNPNRNRIVGGTVAPSGSSSICWQVALLQSDPRNGNYTAWSGTIVGTRTILTTAHNVVGLFFLDYPNETTTANFHLSNYPITATIGVISQNLSNIIANPYPDVVPYCSRTYHVSKAILHPSFDENVGENDIAILVLDEAIEFRDHEDCACPLCLADKNPVTMENCILSGWGSTSDLSNSLPISGVTQLSYVDIPVVPGDRCVNASNPDVNLNFDLMICTGGVPGKDACFGDGGGPLVCYDSEDNVQYLAGIFSASQFERCQGNPILSTKVSYYLSWIFDNAPLGDISIMQNGGSGAYGQKAQFANVNKKHSISVIRTREEDNF